MESTEVTNQLRRCVRAVAQSRAKAAGRRTPSPADTSAAFAICSASLQDKGYLVPGTKAPTLLGLMRSLDMAKEPDHDAKLLAYEQQLASDRMTRMLQRIRGHQAARRGKQGAANKALTRAAIQQAAKTPTEVKALLQPLRHALEDVFSCSTAFGDCSKDRPSTGHCFLVSLFVNDILGGEIVTSTVRDIPHYWCRVPVPNANGGDSGKFMDVDLTGDQFFLPAVQVKRGALYPKATVFDRQPGERLNQPENRKVMAMYDRLLKRVVPVLRKEGHGALACQIEVSCRSR